MSSQPHSHASLTGTAPYWSPFLTANSGKLPDCYPARDWCGIPPGTSQFLSFSLALLTPQGRRAQGDIENVATKARGCPQSQGCSAKPDGLHNHRDVAPSPIVSSTTKMQSKFQRAPQSCQAYGFKAGAPSPWSRRITGGSATIQRRQRFSALMLKQPRFVRVILAAQGTCQVHDMNCYFQLFLHEAQWITPRLGTNFQLAPLISIHSQIPKPFGFHAFFWPFTVTFRDS